MEENILRGALPLTLHNLGPGRTPEIRITYDSSPQNTVQPKTVKIRGFTYQNGGVEYMYSDQDEDRDVYGNLEQIIETIMDQADIHYGILKIQYDVEIDYDEDNLENVQILYSGNINRALAKLRTIPRILGLHARAVRSANDPGRLQELGLFNDPERLDQYMRPQSGFGKRRNTIDKMIRYLLTL